jgi:hypothetical protein
VIGVIVIGVFPQPFISLAQKMMEPIASLGAIAPK